MRILIYEIELKKALPNRCEFINLEQDTSMFEPKNNNNRLLFYLVNLFSINNSTNVLNVSPSLIAEFLCAVVYPFLSGHQLSAPLSL